MFLNKTKIIARLEEHKKKLIEAGYDEDRMLGIFLYGSQNYDMATEESDVDSIVIYLPTFEDFCLNKEWVSKEYKTKENEHILLKDIRHMREMWMKQNCNFLEILFTEYCILNPKYENLFQYYFIDNREDIAHYDRQKAVRSVCGQMKSTLSKDLTPKKIYNGARLFHLLTEYAAGKPYAECIKPRGTMHNYLWDIKYGEEEFEMDWINEQAEILRNNFTFLEDVLVPTLDSPRQEAANAALIKGVCEILKLSFTEEAITRQDFKKLLTATESKAFKTIIDEIGNEGNISLSQMVKKYSISRPVYDNLLSKMKEYHLAEVIPQGVKGTYVKFRRQI